MRIRNGILLIGGNGFLGQALARSLADHERNVHVVSRNAEPGTHGRITFHRGSQDDGEIILPLLDECETVVHLASATNPGLSARKPEMECGRNMTPIVSLIEILSCSPPDRLIFVSSGGVIYGNTARLPVDESSTPQPLSYYAAGKIAQESFFSAFAHANKVSFAVLRPSNLYGPGQHLRGGFGLVRTLLDRASHDRPVEVWGDGTAVRDYLFIGDIVEACTTLIGAKAVTGTFNVGSAEGHSIMDLIRLVEQITDRRLKVVQRPARDTDVRAIVLDSARLREATGWSPRVDLEEGLRRTWDWIQTTAGQPR